MTNFYEHWKTGCVPAAEALRRAQAHVRAQAKWRHPRYWAAWLLWGLAD
jgi:CHAT domain-containing protein